MQFLPCRSPLPDLDQNHRGRILVSRDHQASSRGAARGPRHRVTFERRETEALRSAEGISMSSSFGLSRVAGCLSLAIALLPQPGNAASADNGSRLAHRWCEACHVVTPT